MLESFFVKVLNLKNIPRQGWKEKLEMKDVESVADHTYLTAVMSMVFSDMQNLNTEKIVKMALLHDLAESITGDITPDKITKEKKNKIETDAIKNILQNLPSNISQTYFKIWNEYQENCTSEAILLHEIDKLEMAFQAKSYQSQGISDEKIISFLQPAINNIKNKKVKEVLSKFLEQ